MAEQFEETLEKLNVNEDEVKPDKNYGWGIRHVQVLCLSTTMFVLFMGRTCMGVAVLAMTDQKRLNDPDVKIFDWDKKTQSVILSSFFWGYLVMQIPSGLLAKRFGGKPVIMVSLVMNAILNMALPFMAQLGNWQMVCLARVMMGLTQSCLFPTSHTLVGRWLPAHERTTYSSFVFGGGKLGIIVGLPLYGILAETRMGWPLMFYASAVVLSINAVVWWKLAASTPGDHAMITDEERVYIEKGLSKSSMDNVKIPWKGILTNRHFWAIMVSHIGFNIYFAFLFVDMPTYMERGLGISLKNSATLSAMPYIGMWFASIIVSVFADKLVNKGYMSVTTVRKVSNSLAYMGIAGGLVAMAFVGIEDTNLAIVIVILSFSMEGFISAGFIINHLDLSPNFGGVTLSITNAVSNVFTTLTPIMTSIILRNDPTDLSRWHMVFLITAAVAVGTNFVYVCLASGKRQPYDDPDFFKDADPEELKSSIKKPNQKHEKEKQ